jgi:hypothetical protein
MDINVRGLSEALREQYRVRVSPAQILRAFQSEDWDVLLLLAQCCNALAKSQSPYWYGHKEEILRMALSKAVPSLRYRDGVIYGETSEGQVSFHVFDDLADRACVVLGEEDGEVWVEDLPQKEAAFALARCFTR